MGQQSDSVWVARLKATVALAALRGDQTVPELARYFGLSEDQVREWKEQLEHNAEAAFTAPPAPAARAPATNSPIAPTTVQLVPPTLPNWAADAVAGDGAALAGAAGATDLAWQRQGEGAARSRATQARHTSWPDRLIGPLLVGWRERHHATRVSKEMLRLYASIAATHPGLAKIEIYRQVVAARTLRPLSAADEVLSHAEESFATWPVPRNLTFRDVVHYLAVSEYLASADGAPWTRQNLGRVVADLVPDGL